MKRFILFLTIAVLFSQSQAQELLANEVPPSPVDAPDNASSSVKNIEWNSFASYDASGKLTQTEVKIVVSALPDPVIEYLKKNYEGGGVKETSAMANAYSCPPGGMHCWLMKEAFRITDANGTVTYKVEVNGMELTFDSKGNFIKFIKK